jgi:aminopeptidase N
LQNQVEAEVSIELSLTDALESLSLDFIGFDIQDVLVNGESTEFQRTPRKLLVLLPENSAAGDSPTLTVRYNGQTTRRPSLFAPFESHLGLFFPDGESLYVLSEPDGSRYWFPNNDHPRDKATYRFELTVPSRLTAVANGTLLDTQPNGDHTTYIWEHDAPMASYLTTVAVGRYTVLEGEGPNGLPLRDYVFSADLTRWEREFANTAEALAWFEGMLGPYPFETYGHVDVNASGIALETQTMVVMSTDMIDEDVMVHEMAHQWFGDWVSLDSWGEMWRNEGFASYFEFLWPEREGLTAFNNEMNLLQASIESRDTLQPLDALSPSNLFGYEVYIKGAVVAHALRNEVGDEAFFSSLRLYFSRYGGATASNTDFQEVFEETSGQDLDEFFSYWLSQ